MANELQGRTRRRRSWSGTALVAAAAAFTIAWTLQGDTRAETLWQAENEPRTHLSEDDCSEDENRLILRRVTVNEQELSMELRFEHGVGELEALVSPRVSLLLEGCEVVPPEADGMVSTRGDESVVSLAVTDLPDGVLDLSLMVGGAEAVVLLQKETGRIRFETSAERHADGNLPIPDCRR